MMRILIALAVLAATPVVADEGELQLHASAALEAATIRHPLATSETASEILAELFSAVPHGAFGARYSLTNELQLGFAGDVGAASNVATYTIVLDGTEARLVTGAYFEFAAPMSIGWRFDSGGNVTAAVLVEVAPTFSLWSATAAAEVSKPSGDDPPRRLPLDVADTFTTGVQSRLELACDARVFGEFGIRLGTYIGAAWSASPSVRAGLRFETSWIGSLGPM